MNLVQSSPDIVGKSESVLLVWMACAATGKYHRRTFWHGGAALGFGPGSDELAPLDKRGSQHGAVIEARTRHGLPRGAEFVEIEGSGHFAHLFESDHGPFGTLCPLNLGLEFMGVNFGSIGSSEERSDFVGCAVDCGRFAGRGTVKHVDERPAEVLGIGLQRSPRDHRK